MNDDSRKPAEHAVRWEITPVLWSDDTFKEAEINDLTIFSNGKSIEIRIDNPIMTRDEFLSKAEEIILPFITSLGLYLNNEFHLQGKTVTWEKVVSHRAVSLMKLQVSAKVTTSEGIDLTQDAWVSASDILQRSDQTLMACLDYFALAYAGTNQLTIAGNLYKVMESIISKFGREERATQELNLSRPQFNKTKMWLDRGRHIPRKGSPALTDEILQDCRKKVQSYILAYVKWLKDNN